MTNETNQPEQPKSYTEWVKSLTDDEIAKIYRSANASSFTGITAEAYAAYLLKFTTAKAMDYNSGYNDGYFKGLADGGNEHLKAEIKRLNERIKELESNNK